MKNQFSLKDALISILIILKKILQSSKIFTSHELKSAFSQFSYD